MCYRTRLNTRIRDIEATFNAHFIDPDKYLPQQEINAFDFPLTPIITDDEPGDILFFQWGLVPFWAKDNRIEKMTLNSKLKPVKKNRLIKML